MAETLLKKGVIEPKEAHDLYLAGEKKQGPPVIFLDATFGMKESLNRRMDLLKDKWAKERIHNAVFFDHDAICASDSDPVTRPHMIPPAREFGKAAGRLGISNDHLIIAYSQDMLPKAAPRAWWLFRLFGHDKILVLNGSLKHWTAAGLPVNRESPAAAKERTFVAKQPDPAMLATMAQLEQASETGSPLILDARPSERFKGSEPEPRPGIPSGHIPGSRSIPAASLIGPDEKILPDPALEAIFSEIDGPVYASCGSGVTAAMIVLARYKTGLTDTPLSDDSWTVWAQTHPEQINTV